MTIYSIVPVLRWDQPVLCHRTLLQSSRTFRTTTLTFRRYMQSKIEICMLNRAYQAWWQGFLFPLQISTNYRHTILYCTCACLLHLPSFTSYEICRLRSNRLPKKHKASSAWLSARSVPCTLLSQSTATAASSATFSSRTLRRL